MGRHLLLTVVIRFEYAHTHPDSWQNCFVEYDHVTTVFVDLINPPSLFAGGGTDGVQPYNILDLNNISSYIYWRLVLRTFTESQL